MNRRQVLLGLGAVGLGSTVFSSFKWYSLTKSPDKLYLSNSRQLLIELTDTIIPTTNTPGAKESNIIDTFLDLLINTIDTKSLNLFIDGLKNMEEECLSSYGLPFQKCSKTDRIELISKIDKASERPEGLLGKAINKFIGRSFFQTLKEYTALAYFSSQTGATVSLSYIDIPGRYDGCIDIDKNQKSWATE